MEETEQTPLVIVPQALSEVEVVESTPVDIGLTKEQVRGVCIIYAKAQLLQEEEEVRQLQRELTDSQRTVLTNSRKIDELLQRMTGRREAMNGDSIPIVERAYKHLEGLVINGKYERFRVSQNGDYLYSNSNH